MQQPQHRTAQKSSPGEYLAHCKSNSTGSKVRLLFSILISEQPMTCLDNHRTALLSCAATGRWKSWSTAVPQCKGRPAHTSDGWNPTANWLCRQGNCKGSSCLLKALPPLLQISVPLVTLMQLFVRLLSKWTANMSQLEQGQQKCIKTNSVIHFSTQTHKQHQENKLGGTLYSTTPFCSTLFPYIGKLHCETLRIHFAEGKREGRDKNILYIYIFFCVLFPCMAGPFRLRYCSNVVNNAQAFSWMVKYS